MPEVKVYWLVIAWIVSNVISTMPSVEDMKACGWKPGTLLLYKWVHDVLHVVVGNAARVIPQLRLLAPGPNGNGDSNDLSKKAGTNGS